LAIACCNRVKRALKSGPFVLLSYPYFDKGELHENSPKNAHKIATVRPIQIYEINHYVRDGDVAVYFRLLQERRPYRPGRPMSGLIKEA